MCNNSSCGCNFNRCRNLGPFTAVDRDCMFPDPFPRFRAGYMIPYASLLPFTLFDSTPTPDANLSALIAFGSSVASPVISGVDGSITLIGSVNEAFSVSQAGSITAISAAFTTTAAITIVPPATAVVTARIYRAAPGSNSFFPTSAFVDILTTSVSVASDITNTNSSSIFPPVTIEVGERLLMVYSATVSGTGTVSAVTGTASASITIS